MSRHVLASAHDSGQVLTFQVIYHQEIVDLRAQYPAFRPHEIATICFVKFNRKPAPATVKLVPAKRRLKRRS